MTRNDFIDNVETWSDLIEFCEDERCDLCSDVVSDDTRNEWIEEHLVDYARNQGWRDLLDTLRGFEDNDGYDWYIYDDYYDTYEGATDSDFDERKEQVIQYMDDGEWWEEERDDEEEEPDCYQPSVQNPVDPEDLTQTPEEECSFAELFAASVGCLHVIEEERAEKERRFQEILSQSINF